MDWKSALTGAVLLAVGYRIGAALTRASAYDEGVRRATAYIYQ